MPKLTIEEMQSLAKKRGGKCLSKRYVNQRTKLEWECAKGHRWKAGGSSVKSGSWCLECSGSKKHTIQEMRALAKKHGGKCLSKTYVNLKTKLEWQCAKGHRWRATPSDVKHSNSWCPDCAGSRKLTIEEMCAIAKERGGKCLSKRYVNGKTKLEWECAAGHRWKSLPTSVKNDGDWCLKCSGSEKLTIELMQSMAKERGGKCLSKRYVNSHTKLKWECAHGHRWMAKPYSIKNSMQWCSQCSGGVSERICRSYLKQLFGKPFPKSRPNWLKSSRGGQLELDGYCKALRLAFEHQGEQHYRRVPHWESNRKFKLGLQDDKEKQSLCKKHGVRLIAIPELFSMTKLEDLQQFIYDECKRLRVRRPKGMLEKKIKVTKAWVGTRTSKALEEMRGIAKSRGGRCLSNLYINQNVKLEWECAKGHRWMAAAGNIKHGNSWCLECAGGGRVRLTIEKMKELAKNCGGQCLSKRYVNSKTKLEWQCDKGHRWMASPNAAKRGRWCPDCAGRRPTIESMRALAKERGGRCLSKRYVNSQTKLQWECSQGHRWKATPASVKHGSWCRVCNYENRPKKLGIKDFQAIAKGRGGKCLSRVYVSKSSKLRWECAKGHRWRSTPTNVKNNESWCPACSRSRAHDKMKLGIAQMQSMAKERGGKCLSKRYVNNKTKLEWQCAKGHRWSAVPASIKNRGSWCPKC